MKPLIVVAVFNRADETRRTLLSLKGTGACVEGKIVVFDNDSQDGAGDLVYKMISRGDLGLMAEAVYSPANIGCPRALNMVMEQFRQPGQALIKVDNDVIFDTHGWVGKLAALAEAVPGLALLSPYYHDVFQGRRATDRGAWFETFPIVGHCVYHAGWFLDEVGYFDVLAPDHLYGFEDLLMCHRAVKRGYVCGVHRMVFMENIQRHSSLDVAARNDPDAETRKDHVARLRALYDERIGLTASLGHRYYVNEAGQIQERR